MSSRIGNGTKLYQDGFDVQNPRKATGTTHWVSRQPAALLEVVVSISPHGSRAHAEKQLVRLAPASQLGTVHVGSPT